MKASVQEDALTSYQLEWESLKTYLGFSEYEARVYGFLVREGPSTARKISIGCGVPRTKVYCVLRRLIEQNMIFEVPLKPKLFAALPPSEALKPLIDLQERTIRLLNEIFLDLQRKYEESTGSKILREETWILSGEKALRELLNLLSSAKRRVEIFSSWKLFLHTYRFLRGISDDLLERGVNICLYFPINSKVNRRICYNNMGLHYKVVCGLPIALIISIDDDYIILYTTEDKDDPSFGGEWIIIHTKKLLNTFGKILLYIKEKHARYTNRSSL